MAAGCKPVRVEVAVHPVNPASPQDLHLRGMPTAELKELACRYADKVPPSSDPTWCTRVHGGVPHLK